MPHVTESGAVAAGRTRPPARRAAAHANPGTAKPSRAPKGGRAAAARVRAMSIGSGDGQAVP